MTHVWHRLQISQRIMFGPGWGLCGFDVEEEWHSHLLLKAVYFFGLHLFSVGGTQSFEGLVLLQEIV